MKLPKVVYARIERDGDGKEWINAGEKLWEIVGDSSARAAVTVGVYELRSTKRVKKLLHVQDVRG